MRPIPTCRVLDIPAWVWTAWEVGSSIAAGTVGPGDVTSATWELGRVADGALARARRTAAEVAAKIAGHGKGTSDG